MADNARTATAAAIKRASQAAQRRGTALDAEALTEVSAMYKRAADEIAARIRAASDAAHRIALDHMQAALTAARQRLAALTAERNRALAAHIQTGARIGAEPFADAIGATLALDAMDQAALTVRTFIADDGLQLSDRLWRLDQAADRVVADAIQSAVIQGNGASQAAAELLSRGEAVPAEITAKIDAANADAIAERAARDLMTGEGSPHVNALRVFRTEINRAHNLAYENAAFEYDGTVGTKFELSPAHPRVDICDLHASVNLYGLGAGVYPKGKNPYPAHPNTLSFTVAVFGEDLTDADRANVETRAAWLAKQDAATQAGVLGVAKAKAFRAGVLKENQFATPWHILKERYASRGIDTAAFE